ncbi:hypothetical protein RHGRI_020220 [Rhododendron griersonianum]|uniref:Uncharacterized protein n=1 Tax=Rhododendron griersonianum TaxID=479676 RepID=A0AAV6JFL1_9ERIC|nr:hypothetical protein RHGRI_020220 [Rhododendron griersonianum]
MPRPSAGRAFNGGINVAFINVESYNMISQQRPEPTPRHTVFAFLISSLFNFLDLRYQGNGTASPFQTDPNTMWVAVSSSLLYCFAYAAELEPRFAQLGRAGMGLFGTILSVSLASVLFRNSVSFVLYSLCVLVFNREMLCSIIEVFWSWIRARMVVPITRYQGNGIVNPFQTHPKTMYLAFACVLFYSFAYAAELEPRFAHLGRGGMALFGSILSVSLASVLFRNAVSLALYSLFVLFSNREMLCSIIEAFWSWIRRRNTLVSENRGGLQSENSDELIEIV